MTFFLTLPRNITLCGGLPSGARGGLVRNGKMKESRRSGRIGVTVKWGKMLGIDRKFNLVWFGGGDKRRKDLHADPVGRRIISQA